MFRPRKSLALLSLACMLALAACQPAAAPSAAPTPQKPLVVAMEDDPKCVPQVVLYDNAGWFMSTMIFDRLVAMDYGPDFELHPDLAQIWEAGADGKSYTFHLVKNAKWHDGVPFTSADVKYTYGNMVQQKGQAAATMATIDRIETPDDYTVIIYTKTVDGSFLAQLGTYPRTHILPKHIYEGKNWVDNPANMKPIGTGPYKWSEYTQGSHVTLVRNDDYFRGKAPFEKVIWKIVPDENVQIAQLKAGEIDSLRKPPDISLQSALNQAPGVAVDMPAGPMTYYIGFNNTKAPFDNLKVRQAMAYAIDRTEITNKLVKGVCQVVDGTYEPSVKWAYNPNTKLPTYDSVKAGQLLDEAGFKADAKGVRFAMKITVSRNLEINMAEVVKEQLRKVGVEVTIEQMDDSTMRTAIQTKNDHQAYLYGNWWGPDPAEWETYTRTGQLWAKPLHYDNPEVDALFDQGKASLDRTVRAKAYFKIQEIMLRDMPRIPIFGACPYSHAHTTKYVGWFSQAPVSYRMDVMSMKLAK